MSEETVSDTAEPEATIRGGDGWVTRLLARREIGVFIGFLFLFGLIAVTKPNIFFNWDSMSGITARLLRQISVYVIIGIGMTYLIIGGEFDLSVGSMFAVGGLTFAMFLGMGLPQIVALLLVLVLGMVVGVINGTIVTKAGIPSLITTIGMLSALRGIALYITPGGSRQVPETAFINLFGGSVHVFGLEIAHQVFWSIGLVVVFGYVLQRTRFGYHVYAVGDDEEAAQMTGINTDRVKMINFVITGALAAFAGITAISYFGSMFGTAGQTYELLVIASVVIGGTNLFGGEGSLSGTFLGALVIGVIPVLLVLNGLPVEVQEFLTGVVIIAAVLLDITIRR
ncbi:MAG: ABC transporter permease [Halobacteriaceae archaeon]